MHGNPPECVSEWIKRTMRARAEINLFIGAKSLSVGSLQVVDEKRGNGTRFEGGPTVSVDAGIDLRGSVLCHRCCGLVVRMYGFCIEHFVKRLILWRDEDYSM